MKSIISPDATSVDDSVDDSVEAAAAAFQGLLSRPAGSKKTPGETSPENDEPGETPEPEDADVGAPEDESESLEPDNDEETDKPEGESEDESESETDVEEEPEDESETETEPTVRSRKLRMPDGTEQDVSEDEAYNGYLRTADYTRKSQANAELKKQAEAEQAQAREIRTQYAAKLEQVKQAMDAMVPKEPNWTELRAKLTPEEFTATFADYQQFSKNRAEVIAAQERVAKEAKADFEKQLGEFRTQEEEKILQVVPEWRETTKAQAEGAELKAYARARGFTDEEIDSIIDSRVILMLRDATQWGKLQKAKPDVQAKIKGKTKPKIKSAPAGSQPSKPKPVSDEKRAKDALRQSGSVRDAASVFSTMLGRKGPQSRG